MIEAASWIAAPAVGRMLRYLGADVIKVEPRGGDGLRGMANPARRPGVNPPFEVTNFGKRSVVLDLGTAEARTAFGTLLETADVLVTNLAPAFLEKHQMDYSSLRERFPRLIYCLITGYGSAGVDANRPAFDGTAYWASSGLGSLISEGFGTPVVPRAAMGDHSTALAAFGGVSAALYARERSGRGRFVETSLRSTAAYTVTWDLANRDWVGRIAEAPKHAAASNPLNNSYRLGDGNWVSLANLQSDRAWPGLCRALDLDLLNDPRFATSSLRAANRHILIAEFDAAFQRWTLNDLGPRLDAEHQLWAPFVSAPDIISDPAVEELVWQSVSISGVTRHIPHLPMRVEGCAGELDGMVPELGQHTEELLLELGLTWEQISDLS